MVTTRKHTLEKIVDKLGANYDEERLHTALLLAFTSAAYGIMVKDCVPTTLYRFQYEEKNNRFSMEETKGLSLPPEKGALDISILDEIFCSNIRDIPILMEGESIFLFKT
jgi:hypothetical protein